MISVSRTSVEMGTAVSLTLHGRKGLRTAFDIRGQLNSELERTLGLIGDLDRFVLSWRSEASEVSRFNQGPAHEEFPVSTYFSRALRESLELTKRTNGAVDITLRPLIAVWGIEDHADGQPFTPPSLSVLQEIAEHIGTEHLTFDGSSLMKDDPDVQLDFGAVGKGYALDIAVAQLCQDRFVSGAVLAAGGSILTYGSKGEPFRVGIRDPEGIPTDYLGILTVSGDAGQAVFISTSGGYEKYAEADGKVYEHIISAQTLSPAESELYSATVITGSSGLASDGLSTACYILGPEASYDILKQYGAEAIFVYRDHSILLTEGVKDSFTLTVPDYHIIENPAESSRNAE